MHLLFPAALWGSLRGAYDCAVIVLVVRPNVASTAGLEVGNRAVRTTLAVRAPLEHVVGKYYVGRIVGVITIWLS